MIEKFEIDKPGFNKEQLLEKLKGFREKYKDEIHNHNIQFTQLDDGYLFNVRKKIFFMSFYVNGEIKAEDGKFRIEYETNAPKNKVEEAVAVIEEALINS